MTKDIFTLVEEGNAQQVEAMVRDSPLCVNDYNKSGVTPLGLAVQRKQINVVKRLVACEADVNARCTEEAGTYRGYTPVHFAAKNDDTTSMQLLFERGAALKLQGKDGWAPIHLAAFSGALEALKWLISKGVDVNVFNEHKVTPLVTVVSQGKIDAARILFKAGAKTNVKDVQGDTIFHHALHYSMYKLFEGGYSLPDIQIDSAVFLALHGVDPETLNREGTPATKFVEKELGSSNFTNVLKLIYMNHEALLKGEGEITEHWNYLTLLAIKSRSVFEQLGVVPQQAKDLVDLLHAFEAERQEKNNPKKKKRVAKKREKPVEPPVEKKPTPKEEDASGEITPEVQSLPTPETLDVEGPLPPPPPAVSAAPAATTTTFVQSVPTTIEHRLETTVEKIVEVKWEHPSSLPPPEITWGWAYQNRTAILCCIICFLLGTILGPGRC